MVRRLAAIMFTDLVGSTELAHRDERAALDLLARQEEMVRPLLAAHSGRLVKSTGDGMLVEFSNALDAVKCAVEFQQQARERASSGATPPLRVRIGIHLGDVEGRGDDILGDAVNIAARVEPLAEDGGICLSEPVYVQIRNKVPFALESMGMRNLKGVAEPMGIYRVAAPRGGGSASPRSRGPPRLAVLPLTNISPDPSDEYFADGLTEEMIARLSLLKGLEVIARTSVMGYKKKDKTATEIGKELGVGTLLEGSVRKAGKRIRVTVQLIDTGNEAHLWAESYDRDLEDIFEVQSEIAGKVADSLKVRLLAEEREKLVKRATDNLEAYTLVLKGRFHLSRWSRDALPTAIRFLEEATAADPGYAAPYAHLARAYHLLMRQDRIDPEEGLRKVEEYARRALELDESSAEAHELQALVLSSRYDWAGEEQELRRAIDLNPNLAAAHYHLAAVLSMLGDREESTREATRAVELDPLSIDTLRIAGSHYLYARDYEKALRMFEGLVDLDPLDSHSLHNLGLTHLQLGQIEKGLEELERAATDFGPRMQDACLAYGYVKAGRPEEARRLLGQLLRPKEGERTPPVAVAGIYAVLGEKERALEWLERAYNERSASVAYVATDFVFEGLRDEPGYRAFLEKLHLARAR